MAAAKIPPKIIKNATATLPQDGEDKLEVLLSSSAFEASKRDLPISPNPAAGTTDIPDERTSPRKKTSIATRVTYPIQK